MCVEADQRDIDRLLYMIDGLGMCRRPREGYSANEVTKIRINKVIKGEQVYKVEK